MPRTRARGLDHPAWPLVLATVARGLPLEPACAEHGLSVGAVRNGLDHDPDARDALDAARADGERAVIARMETSDDWRREAWLLERLYPKRYHLPNRVTGVAPEDGGAPIATAELRVALDVARLGARDDYAGPLPALPAPSGALPGGRDGSGGGADGV